MYILYENEPAVNVRLDVKTLCAHTLAPSEPRWGVGSRWERILAGGCHLGASEVQTRLTWGSGFCLAVLGAQVTPVASASPCLSTAQAYVVPLGGSLCCWHSLVYLVYKGSACNEDICSTDCLHF